MSAKERLLSSAQKFILKGQIDRAVKDYEQVVAIDPDVRHRQKLAELLVRTGRKEDAVKEYVKIADFYANNGFYLKSIAVYKQVQKITPTDINVTISLASLNQKQGLKGNALAEYKTAVDYFEKAGRHAEAAKLLETMASIDVDNANIRHKLAETLFAAGDIDGSYQSFMNLVLFLRNQGSKEGVERIYSRIQKLFPQRTDFIFDVLGAQIQGGAPLEAVSRLKQLVKSDPRQRRPWDLLLLAYTAAGDRQSRKAVCKQMIKFFPDDPAPREEFIQCSIDDNEIDEGLVALGDYSDRFLLKGGKVAVEALYRRFYEVAPDNVRVLEELQDFYGRTGQEAKQSDILARLAILSSTDTFEEPHEELFTEEVSPVQPPPHQPIPESGSWEEEIDLSLSDDYYLDIDFEGVEQETLSPALSAEEPLAALDDIDTFPTVNGETVNEDDFEPFTADEIEASFLSFDTSDKPPGADEEAQEPDATGGTDAIGFEGMLAESLQATELQSDAADTETHYDLGIAYKEMGLWNEAIAEFSKAATDPHRRIDCLILQGICYRDKGDLQTSENVLQKGLASGVTLEERGAIEYEMGVLCERSGRYSDALAFYRNACAAIPGFRDAEEKVAALSSLVGDMQSGGDNSLEIDLDDAL